MAPLAGPIRYIVSGLPTPNSATAGRGPLTSRTTTQVRLFEQLLEYLAIGQSLLQLDGNHLAHVLGHPAGVGIATGQSVEIAGAGIAVDAAGTVNAGQKPLDSL